MGHSTRLALAAAAFSICGRGDLQAQTAGGAASRQCAGCHREIWEAYRQTGMGRSFYRPAPERMAVENFAAPHSTYYHAASDSYFTMEKRDDGRYYQRRHQLDAAGQPVNVLEKSIDYVLGSGNRARTYLHRTPANTLIELPLGWYSEKGGYFAMNPGYDRPDHDGFRRPVTYDCMFCHNAYPAIPAGHERTWAEPVYRGELPEGIDCARCHGDGARHAQLAGRAKAPQAQVRAAIVNPGRLAPERQLEICMACHLESTSYPLPNAIQRYSRGPFSFQPGEPLAAFLLNFDHAPGTGRDDKFEIVNAAYRLRKSACFARSAGRLLCTTCHDPHRAPRGEEAVRHYDAACRQCHGAAFDQLVAGGRHTRTADCAGCHMPKRRTEDVVHAVATDHLVQRRPPEGDLLAERAERHETGDLAYRGPVAPYYPAKLDATPDATPEDELYLAVAQVKQKSNLAGGIPQLTAAIQKHRPARAEWYLELAEALDVSGRLEDALPWYREAARRDPASAASWQRLGTALRRLRRGAEAVEALNRSASLAPARAMTWHELGLAYRAQSRAADATRAMETALARDGESPEAHNNLGMLRLEAGEPARAEQSFREAIRLRPEYPDAQGNLGNLLAAAGEPVRLSEAAHHFSAALRTHPRRTAELRYGYAMVLGRLGRYDEAQRELEACLAEDAARGDAQELLGNLLLARGNPGGAAERFRAAVRLRPSSGRAQLGLGLALLGTGDRAGALPHLRRAAEDGDAAVRARAREALQAAATGVR